MAAASYSHDLTDWIADADTTAWGELTGAISGGAPDEADTESALQGTNTVSQSVNTTNLASMARILAAPVTLSSGQVALVWHGHGVATALNTYANAGFRVAFATTLANWKSYTVGGSDVAPMPYGKWVNNAVDPTLAADNTNGTPPTNGTNIYGIGSMCQQTATVAKGQPHVCDIIRYGRAEARFSGGDLANGYATFSGFATLNDAQTARWGLIQSTTGGYQWKGLMTLGYTSAVDFRDSNKNIFIQDCRKVSSTFNKIEVRQAGSRVDWTGISFINASPSTNASKGAFECIDDADVNIESCQFVDMDTFTFQSTSTILSTIFRRCNTVTQGGATITSCIFDRPFGAKALIASNVGAVTSCDFISSGTGYAIEGFATAGDYSVSTNTFTGYGTTGTANAALRVTATTGTVNINAPGGTTYHSAGATVNIISGQRTLTLTGIASGSDIVILTAGTTTELANIDANAGSTYPYNYTFAASTFIDVCVYKAGYVPFTARNYLLADGDGSLPVSQVIDRNYLP